MCVLLIERRLLTKVHHDNWKHGTFTLFYFKGMSLSRAAVDGSSPLPNFRRLEREMHTRKHMIGMEHGRYRSDQDLIQSRLRFRCSMMTSLHETRTTQTIRAIDYFPEIHQTLKIKI